MNYRYRNENEFKNSNINWIGRVPNTWSISRLKYIVQRKKFSIVDGPFGTQFELA